MKSTSILPLLGLLLSVMYTRGTPPTYDVNVGTGSGYTLAADQLPLVPNDLANTALGQMLSKKAQVITWDVASQTFLIYTKAGVPPTWSADPPITVGEGFYCNNPLGPSPGPLPVPFTGVPSRTPTAIPSFSPTTLWYLLGSQTYFDDISPGSTYNYDDITGYPTPLVGESLYRARNAVAGGTPVNTLPPTSPTDWNEYRYDGAWHPADPAIYLGEAVWIGPSSCTIEGTVTDGTGAPLANWLIALSDGQYTYTDSSGHYRFGVFASGEYTVTPLPPCGWTYNSSPQPVSVSCPGAAVEVTPFRGASTANTGPDLSVQVIYIPDPGNPNYPCANDTGSYYVYYYNKCGATVPAGSTLTVTLSPWVSYGNAGNPNWTQTPPTGGGPAGGFSISGNMLNWTLGPLPAGAIGVIRIPIQVGNVSPVKTYNGLSTSADIFLPTGYTDSNLNDNKYISYYLARCSFDPNDKTVEPAGCGPTGLINGNQPLTYTVQFQNVGSAPAFQVVVTDQLDASLDPSTLKILGASANYVFALNGNQMTWTFPNIFLPDATEDPQGSHGFVMYQVQPLPGLADGTVITNQSSIVFDKNPPVLTAITTNTITSATMPVASFTVSPRPGSAGHTNDFTYTGGTPGVTFYWDFGPDAIPPTSTNMNPSGVVFPTDGLRTINLQVFDGDCEATPASYLLSVGRPVLSIGSTVSNQVVLSWQGDGYSVQQSGTLSAPVPWQSLSLPVTQVGATHFTSLGVTNVVRFYRLTDQP